MTPELQQAISLVFKTCTEMKIDAVLVGALVSVVQQRLHPDLPAARRTNDADFAVRVTGWSAYGELRDGLAQKGFSPAPRLEHRLTLGTAVVDLVPYGSGVSNESGIIRWPESEVEMQVTGFEEACKASQRATLDGVGDIVVVTAAGLVLLKVISFRDRLARGEPKHQSDAEDLDYWLRNYGMGSVERPFDLLDLGIRELDIAQSDAAILGCDVGRLASEAAAREVLQFVDGHADLYSPFVTSAVSRMAEEADRERVVDRLVAFKLGFLAGRGLRRSQG